MRAAKRRRNEARAAAEGEARALAGEAEHAERMRQIEEHDSELAYWAIDWEQHDAAWDWKQDEGMES